MLRSLLTAVAVANLALTQSIDFDVVNSQPTPTLLGPPVSGLSQAPTYQPSSAATSAAAAASSAPLAASNKRSIEERRFEKVAVAARSACQTQPGGYGQVTTPDTAAAFLANANYSDLAEAAATPQGYQLVFSDLQAATEQSGYLGYYTLESYDTIECQQYCDATSTCTAFNVFIERDPSVEPGDGCADPASIVNYKCSLYGLPITNTTATNTGQWQDDFQVVIAGSNGYVKNPAPPSYTGFTGPNPLAGAINAPITNCSNSYIGVYFYEGPYNPGQCASACPATTAYDKEHLLDEFDAYDACNFFVAYVLSKNNVPMGTYCSFYTRGWSSKYATNTGQYDSAGNYYSVSSAYSYYLSPQDPGYLLLP